MPRPLIIDCDPGLDDAVAISLAVASPELALEAITTVAGNAPIDTVTRNALGVCDALGIDVPVHRGAGRALAVEERTSAMLWGGDGSLGLPESARAAGPDAAGYLAKCLSKAAPRSWTICPIGPLTNLAHLVDSHPVAADGIDRLVVMGGALGAGNATEHAELNIWVDPHAAAHVVASGIPLTLVPLDLTRKVVARKEDLDSLSGSSRAAARLCARLLPLAGTDSHPASIHDACAIGWLLWPELYRTEIGELSVVTEGIEEGRTLFERKRGGRHRVAVELDVETLLSRMVETLTRVGERADRN